MLKINKLKDGGVGKDSRDEDGEDGGGAGC